MKYVSESESQTLEIGRALGKKMRGGEIITLSGDLGAGKTVFTKGIALGLGITDTVASPTFTLMNEYEGRGSGTNRVFRRKSRSVRYRMVGKYSGSIAARSHRCGKYKI